MVSSHSIAPGARARACRRRDYFVGYSAPAQDGASRVLLGVWTGAITQKRTGPYQTRVGCEKEWEIFPSPKWVEIRILRS